MQVHLSLLPMAMQLSFLALFLFTVALISSSLVVSVSLVEGKVSCYDCPSDYDYSGQFSTNPKLLDIFSLYSKCLTCTIAQRKYNSSDMKHCYNKHSSGHSLCDLDFFVKKKLWLDFISSFQESWSALVVATPRRVSPSQPTRRASLCRSFPRESNRIAKRSSKVVSSNFMLPKRTLCRRLLSSKVANMVSLRSWFSWNHVQEASDLSVRPRPLICLFLRSGGWLPRAIIFPSSPSSVSHKMHRLNISFADHVIFNNVSAKTCIYLSYLLSPCLNLSLCVILVYEGGWCFLFIYEA